MSENKLFVIVIVIVILQVALIWTASAAWDYF